MSIFWSVSLSVLIMSQLYLCYHGNSVRLNTVMVHCGKKCCTEEYISSVERSRSQFTCKGHLLGDIIRSHWLVSCCLLHVSILFLILRSQGQSARSFDFVYQLVGGGTMSILFCQCTLDVLYLKILFRRLKKTFCFLITFCCFFIVLFSTYSSSVGIIVSLILRIV